MSKPASIVAALLFLVVLGLPFYYNLLAAPSGTPPELVLPEGKRECIRPTRWMRDNHMRYLLHERDEVVREGIREEGHGLKGCRSCHTYRDQFCDRCHGYVGVTPECWNCHYYPTSTETAAAPQGDAPAGQEDPHHAD